MLNSSWVTDNYYNIKIVKEKHCYIHIANDISLNTKNKHKVLTQHIFVNNKVIMTCISQKIQFNAIYLKILQI
jgi:hypothetical protein